MNSIGSFSCKKFIQIAPNSIYVECVCVCVYLLNICYVLISIVLKALHVSSHLILTSTQWRKVLFMMLINEEWGREVKQPAQDHTASKR